MPTRGTKGEGSVYQRKKDGRYVASWWAEDGERRRRYHRYAASEGEAKKLLREGLGDRDKGKAPAKGTETLRSWATKWMDGREGGDYSPSTLKREREILELHVLPLVGSRRLRALSVADINDVFVSAAKKKLSARTRFHIHAVIRRCLADAFRAELVSRNVAAVARAPHVARKEVAFLLPSEAEKFRNHLAPSVAIKKLTLEQASLFAAAIDTGARQGELLATRWRDLDLEKASLYISRGVKLGNTIGETKTGRGRTVRFSGEALLLFVMLQSVAQKKGKATGDALVWHRGTDTALPMSASSVSAAIGRYLGALRLTVDGKSKITFHGLRHTVATLLLASSVDENGVVTPGLSALEVAAVLGHSSPGLLWKTYAHLLPQVDQRAMRTLKGHFPSTRNDPLPYFEIELDDELRQMMDLSETSPAVELDKPQRSYQSRPSQKRA